MCGSQNVSGPEIAGPGVGADHAEAAAVRRLGLNRREVCVGHMPLERVAVVFAAHSRLASSA